MCVSTMPFSAFAIAANNNNSIEVVGDLDKDGEITDWDGVLLARHLAGWGGIFDSMVMDVDGDGEITDWDGVIFDRMLAGWSVNTEVGKKLAFNITYLNTKGAAHSNPATLQYGNTETALSEISVTHYAFDGWYEGNRKFTSIPANYNKDLSLTAKWIPIEYSITYNNTKEANNTNPINYNIASDTIILSNLQKEGYTFDGWYNGNQKVTSIPSGSYGNIVLTAKWTPCEYNIIYNNTKGATNNNATGFNTDSETIILSDLHKEGYAFDGWYQNDVKVTEITKGTISDVELTAKWTPVEYNITYNNTKGDVNNNPTSYNIESDTIILSNLQKEGYTFDGWYNGNQKATSIPTGSYGNIVLTAKWTPCDYNIIYNNTKDAINSNATGFNIDSDTIILSDLQKEGYVFEGWYQNGVKITQITKGTIGDVELTAKWTPQIYIATFVVEGIPIDTCEFTIEETQLSFVPEIPFKENYTSEWEYYSLSAKDLTINAIYMPIKYNITYINTNSAPNENPLSYNIETEFVLSEIKRPGYSFEGWYRDGTKVYSIEKGNFGDITLEAKWSLIEYNIIYLNTKDALNENTDSFNVESNEITLKSLTKEYYIFDGWYIGQKKVESIKSGTVGTVELTAKWTPISFNISYINTKNVVNNNPDTYTIEDALSFEPLSVKGYTFNGWYVENKKISSIQAGTTGDIELTAMWTLTEYTVTYASRYGGTLPTNRTYTMESGTVYLPNATNNSDYIFIGWRYNGETVDSISSSVCENVTVYAVWVPKTKKFSASQFGAYDINTGLSMSNVHVEINGNTTAGYSLGYYIVPLKIWGNVYKQRIAGYVYVDGQKVLLKAGTSGEDTYFSLSNFTDAFTVSTTHYAAKVPAEYYSVW